MVLFNLLSKFFAEYGYAAVFIGVMLENAGVPLPGETVLLFGAFLAHQGSLNIWWVIANAFAGGTAGGSVGYYIGNMGGPEMIRRLRQNALFSGPRFDRAEERFQKHAAWAVFGGRFIVGLRIIVGLLAGALRMRFLHFFLLNAAGALLWSATMGGVGYAIGSSWQRIVSFIRDVDWAVLILVIAASIVLLVRNRLRARKLQNQQRTDSRKAPNME